MQAGKLHETLAGWGLHDYRWPVADKVALQENILSAKPYELSP